MYEYFKIQVFSVSPTTPSNYVELRERQYESLVNLVPQQLRISIHAWRKEATAIGAGIIIETQKSGKILRKGKPFLKRSQLVAVLTNVAAATRS